MRYLECTVPKDVAYLLPVGDVHVGDRAFQATGLGKLRGYLDWAAARADTTRIFLLGDIFNVATRISKTSPFESTSGEYAQAVEIFQPYQHLIIGGIDGNHENRARDFMGFSPMESFCRELQIPYCGWSATIRFRVGHRGGGRYRQQYFIFAHHTTGGGGSLGSALNRVVALDRIVRGCDVYLGGHNHQLISGVKEIWEPAPQASGCELRRVHYVACGGYLEWEGAYTERFMMAPSKLGSPRIRFAGGKARDVHISL